MSRAAVVGAAAAAGLAAGVAIAFAVGGPHRAVTSLAVERGGTPVAAPTVAALARTKLFADNLGVSGVHAHVVHGTALVELSYENDSAARATQVVAQAAATLRALVATRFPALGVGVVDPAHAGGPRRHLVWFGLDGVIAGFLVGAFVPLGRRAPTPAVPPSPPDPEPLPELEPVPGTATSPLDALREEVAARRAEFPADQVAEWEAYLEAFEAQVQEGEIPPGLQGMLDDVFEPLRRP